MPKNLSPTTFAMVGSGRMAAVMARDFAASDVAELTTIVSRSLPRARAFADELGVPQAATIADFATIDADVVYIATPHDSHAELAIAAMAGGKHVLLEKAFTMDAAEATTVIEAAARYDRFLMEAMWTRFNPVIRRIQQLISEGSIGEPRSVYASFGRAVPYDPRNRLWDPTRGGGSLLDQGVYPLTLADIVLGEPTRVDATGSRLGYDGDDAGVDTEASVLLGYAGGAQAITSSSIRTAIPWRASIGGREGLIEIEEPFWCSKAFTIHRPGAAPERFDEQIEGQGFLPMLRAVHEAVSEGLREHPLNPLATSLRLMRVVDEVRRQIG